MMGNSLTLIIKELAVRKVEWTPKQRVKINLFEEELVEGIKINSFLSLTQYRNYMMTLYLKVKLEIEIRLKTFRKVEKALKYIERLQNKLHELEQAYLPDNFNFILYSFQIKMPAHQKDSLDIGIKRKIELFTQVQREVVKAIKNLVKRQEKRLKTKCKKKVKKQEPAQMELFQEDNKIRYIWDRSDIDLLELVTAIHESNAIITNFGKPTKDHLLKIMENFFNLEIKNPSVKLSRAKSRKKEAAPFLEELKTTFSSYLGK